MAKTDVLMVNLSGRGDKDMGILARELNLQRRDCGGEGLTMPIEFNKKPGLVVYLTAGDPDLATTRDMALAAIDDGADVIELGVPFSDPLADGPVIQRASERAVASGMRLTDVLDVAKELRAARPAGGLDPLHLSQPCGAHGHEGVLREGCRAPAPTACCSPT